MAIAVGLFERYALGNVSAKDLAEETGLAESRIRMILMNPLYNGWIRRHRRSRPRVAQAGAVARRTRPCRTSSGRGSRTCGASRPAAAGPQRRDRVDLLGGLLECVCGRRVRSDGTFARRPPPQAPRQPVRGVGQAGPARRRDVGGADPGAARGHRARRRRRSAPSSPASARDRGRSTLDRARIDRQIRELALEHAAGRLEDAVYLDRLHELRECEGEPRAHERRRDLGRSAPSRGSGRCQRRGATAEVPEEKADLLHAIYERITVAGRRIVSVRLTPSAYAHGLALALPEKVAMARPTGVGRAIATYDDPDRGAG